MRSSPLAQVAIIVLSLLVAFGAQFLFDHPGASLYLAGRELWLRIPSSPLAEAMLLLAALLFAIAAPAPRYSPLALPDHQPARTASGKRLSRFLLGVSLASYLLTLVIFLALRESPWVHALWLVSILVLVSSQIVPAVRSTGSERWSSRFAQGSSRSRWLAYGLPLLVLALAAALRLWQLTDLPQDVHGDMASHGLQAQAILQGRVPSLIGVGWADIPLIGFLPTVATMALTGDRGLLGLRLASAIGGVLSIAGLYLLLVQLTSQRTALLASALLTIAYTHIHFSRIAQYMDPVPLTIWSLVLLVWGLRRASRLAFVLSGILLAAASLMYYSGRVAIVVVALFLLYLLLTNRPLIWARRDGLLLLGAAYLVGLGPMLPYFLTDMQPLWARTQAVLITDPEVLTHLSTKYGVVGPGPVLAEQARRSLLMFNTGRDSSTQFGSTRPLVDSISGPLVVLGTAHALRYLKQPGYALLLIFLVTLLLSSVLTNNAPFWPRLVAVLLPAAGLAAVAVDRTWQALSNVLGVPSRRWIAIVLVTGFAALGTNNWQIYQGAVAHNGQPRALVGRFVATLPRDATVCLVPETERPPFAGIHSLSEREIAFFLPPRLGLDILGQESIELDSADRRCRETGAVWVVPQSRRPVLQELAVAYPGGHLEQHKSYLGGTVFLSYQLP